MLTSDIIADVLAIFGDKAEVQVGQDDLIRWINEAQLQIARETECIIKTVTPDTSLKNPAYAVPEGFIKFHRVIWNGVQLVHTTPRELDLIHPYRDVPPVVTGTPTRYYLKTKFIWLDPAPDSAGTFSIEYIARPATVIDGSGECELPDTMHQSIIEFCLAKCYELDDNLTAMGLKEKKFQDGVLGSRDEVKWPYDDSYPSVGMVAGDD